MSGKFREQERKWQTRLDTLAQSHKEELFQVGDTSSVSVMTQVACCDLTVTFPIPHRCTLLSPPPPISPINHCLYVLRKKNTGALKVVEPF